VAAAAVARVGRRSMWAARNRRVKRPTQPSNPTPATHPRET
jgi:hypothetical protein